MTGATPRTDRWKAGLRERLAARGAKAELARFLCAGDEEKMAGRVVQIAKVLNQGAIPEAEFVLAVQEWLAAGQVKRSPASKRTGGKRKG